MGSRLGFLLCVSAPRRVYWVVLRGKKRKKEEGRGKKGNRHNQKSKSKKTAAFGSP